MTLKTASVPSSQAGLGQLTYVVDRTYADEGVVVATLGGVVAVKERTRFGHAGVSRDVVAAEFFVFSKEDRPSNFVYNGESYDHLADVYYDRKSYTSDEMEAGVNWSAYGSQSTAFTRKVAAALQMAADIADWYAAGNSFLRATL